MTIFLDYLKIGLIVTLLYSFDITFRKFDLNLMHGGRKAPMPWYYMWLFSIISWPVTALFLVEMYIDFFRGIYRF